MRAWLILSAVCLLAQSPVAVEKRAPLYSTYCGALAPNEEAKTFCWEYYKWDTSQIEVYPDSAGASNGILHMRPELPTKPGLVMIGEDGKAVSVSVGMGLSLHQKQDGSWELGPAGERMVFPPQAPVIYGLNQAPEEGTDCTRWHNGTVALYPQDAWVCREGLWHRFGGGVLE